MKISILYTLLALLGGSAAHAQVLNSVPDQLMENAYSIVINSQTDFTCESLFSATKKESITLAILNEKGKDAAIFHEMCDKFSELRKFSGEVIDKTGKSIHKIKKSDLNMTEYSEGLASDDYSYYYEYVPASYPYIITFEWEIKYKNGLIMYPVFAPQTQFNQSVVQATYRLYTDQPYRSKSLCTDETVKAKQDDKGKQYYEATFSDLKAIVHERYGPSVLDVIPRIYFNPVDFSFDGKAGKMETWQTFGLWQRALLEGRDVLPEMFQSKIKEIAANAKSERETVQKLYEYMQNTTRYISIQLGIGGFQPETASNVNRSKFSDCKGLSNYMFAMLKVMGIPAYYTEISTRQSRLLKDYPSANQTNHVILMVPLASDTVWLECTNQIIPFGYVHKSIAGHDALLIKETGGEVVTLPTYPDSLNIQQTKAIVKLQEGGKANIQVEQKSHLFQYEDLLSFTLLTPDKQKEFLKTNVKLNRAAINNISCTEEKNNLPYMQLRYDIDTEQYGSKTGNRLFIPVNTFRDRGSSFSKERVHDIYLSYGFCDIEEITLELPEGYEIEAIPESTYMETPFGTFRSEVSSNEKSIHVIHQLNMKAGKYSKEKYETFTDFNKKISKSYNDRIILRKQ